MSFTDEQFSRAVRRIKDGLEDAGISNHPYLKTELRAAMNAVKAIIDANPYQNAQSVAIDDAMPAHVVPTSHKKRIHGITLEAIVREGVL